MESHQVALEVQRAEPNGSKRPLISKDLIVDKNSVRMVPSANNGSIAKIVEGEEVITNKMTQVHLSTPTRG